MSSATDDAAAVERAAAEVAVSATSACDAAGRLVAMLTTAEKLDCLDVDLEVPSVGGTYSGGVCVDLLRHPGWVVPRRPTAKSGCGSGDGPRALDNPQAIPKHSKLG